MKRQDLIIVILVVILASAIFSGTMYYWSTVHTPTKADIGVKVVYVFEEGFKGLVFILSR